MVLAGLLLALTPGLPRVELAPELVLLLVLPPLIYSAGVAMSWREFRYNIHSISLLAVGGVTFTAAAVAAVVHFLLGWHWAVGSKVEARKGGECLSACDSARCTSALAGRNKVNLDNAPAL
jgi:NhaP-type Na+/H+ or K+/H+ antiporter